MAKREITQWWLAGLAGCSRISHSVPALGWLHGINALVLASLAVYAVLLATGTAFPAD